MGFGGGLRLGRLLCFAGSTKLLLRLS
jgi:hypothetical protein